MWPSTESTEPFPGPSQPFWTSSKERVTKWVLWGDRPWWCCPFLGTFSVFSWKPFCSSLDGLWASSGPQTWAWPPGASVLEAGLRQAGCMPSRGWCWRAVSRAHMPTLAAEGKAGSVWRLQHALDSEQQPQALLVLGKGPEHTCFGGCTPWGPGCSSSGPLPDPVPLAQASDPDVQGRPQMCGTGGPLLGTEGLLGQSGVWEALRVA